MSEAKIRLYVDQPLAAGQPVALGPDQANYLFAVMRLAVGGQVALFNGRDGEWRAVVTQAGRRAGVMTCIEALRGQGVPCDLWLCFAPIKKVRTDFIVEKAVELGVSRIVPVQTRHTNSERIRRDRLQAHAVEAAEQCGATLVPEVAELVGLDRLLADWPEGRRVMWCDEGLAGAGAGPSATLAGLVGRGAVGPWAVLVGPEGGFSAEEQARLRARPGVQGISLGPRILRADTAAVAALVLWQATLGDWR